jgi:hypothetical protein
MPDVLPTPAAPLLLNRRAAAAYLSISVRALFDLTWPRGSINVVRVGRRSVRYSIESLRAWVESQSTGEGGAA